MTPCPHCGQPLPNSAVRFCPHCGRPIAPAQSGQAVAGPVTGRLSFGQPTRLAGRISIGRDPQCNIPLNDPMVSWHHATIDATDPNAPVITDNNSSNGTYVNGARIRRHALTQTDIIQIGKFTLNWSQLGLTKAAATGGHRLDGRNLTRTVMVKGKPLVILNDVSISIYPGEFVCVVGGSGGGKSTLVKALIGFERAQQGQVLLDGEDVYQQFERLKSQIGYVPQQDIIHNDLSVRRVLYYAGKLRLPPDTRADQLNQRINEVLADLKLTEHADKLVRNLSGGQRKRVSIAVEMLADPKLFVLDEPTSGLDPGLDRAFMELMRDLARGGRTIIVVTHATENIRLCDKVAFMAKGRLVYYGPPANAPAQFGKQQFSEIYNTLESDDSARKAQLAEQAEQRFRQSTEYRTNVATRLSNAPQAPQTGRANKPRSAPLARQTLFLTLRYAELVLRDKTLLFLLLAVMPLVGLLIGALHANQKDVLIGEQPYYTAETFVFIMGFAITLLGLFAASFEIVKESEIYLREQMVNLRLPAYLSSKVLVLGFFAIIQCALFLGVMALTGLTMPAAGQVWRIYVSLLLTSLASILLGLLISAAAPNANIVIYIVLAVVLVQVMFGGTLFATSPVVAGTTVLRWTMNGIGSTIDIKNMALNKGDEDAPIGIAANDECTEAAENKPWLKNPKIDYCKLDSRIVGTWVVLIVFAGLYAAGIMGIQTLKLRRRFGT